MCKWERVEEDGRGEIYGRGREEIGKEVPKRSREGERERWSEREREDGRVERRR